MPKKSKSVEEVIEDVLAYIKEHGVVIKSEMVWDVRRFRDLDRDMLENVLAQLIAEGRVKRHVMSNKTFLCWPYKRYKKREAADASN